MSLLFLLLLFLCCFLARSKGVSAVCAGENFKGQHACPHGWVSAAGCITRGLQTQARELRGKEREGAGPSLSVTRPQRVQVVRRNVASPVPHRRAVLEAKAARPASSESVERLRVAATILEGVTRNLSAPHDRFGLQRDHGVTAGGEWPELQVEVRPNDVASIVVPGWVWPEGTRCAPEAATRLRRVARTGAVPPCIAGRAARRPRDPLHPRNFVLSPHQRRLWRWRQAPRTRAGASAMKLRVPRLDCPRPRRRDS